VIPRALLREFFKQNFKVKSSAGILWCDIHAISHRKSIEDIDI
jgi:hypothetical protein